MFRCRSYHSALRTLANIYCLVLFLHTRALQHALGSLYMAHLLPAALLVQASILATRPAPFVSPKNRRTAAAWEKYTYERKTALDGECERFIRCPKGTRWNQTHCQVSLYSNGASVRIDSTFFSILRMPRIFGNMPHDMSRVDRPVARSSGILFPY